MIFASLVFLCVFFPLNMLCYSLARTIEAKNTILIVFSLVFYAWGEPTYLLLLLLMVVINWGASLFIEKHRGTPMAKWGLLAGCVLSLGLLGYFKYTPFLLTNLQALTGFPSAIPNVILPIGISFYTFQLLSYTVDVYRGDVAAQPRFRRVLLYASLFHQCIAGPIVRYKDVSEEIMARHVTMDDVHYGINRFVAGLGKKVLLANVCGSIADQLLLTTAETGNPANLAANTAFLGGRSVLALWLGMGAFALQIYLDFSAYSDMAIGMGRMTGFHYLENFDYPYMSGTVTEFWRRWHMSLGTFFRDYVYIPIGGNRKGLPRTCLNLFVVWLLTGLWHGASWNFVLWGLYFCFFLILERLFLKRLFEKIPRFLHHLYLLLVVFFGWILFRFTEMPLGWTTFKGLFGMNGNPLTDFESLRLLLNNAWILLVAVVAVTPLFRWLKARLTGAVGRLAAAPGRQWLVYPHIAGEVLVPVAIIFVSIVSLVADSYNPFLYFQF